MSFMARLRAFDINVKTTEDALMKRTLCGASVTVVFAVLAVMLFFSELSEYVRSEVVNHLDVDDGLSDNIEMTFDVVLHEVPCTQADLNIIDSRGLTYKDLKVQASKLPWAPPHAVAAASKDPSQATGCNIKGTATIRKVAGAMEITTRSDARAGAKQALAAAGLGNRLLAGGLLGGGGAPQNASHEIRTLSFGPAFPGQVEALAGAKANLDDSVGAGVGSYQYFLAVVPTVYQSRYGSPVVSHQYSSTEFVENLGPNKDKGHGHADEDDFGLFGLGGAVKPAGLSFTYEFSPIKVRLVEETRTFFQFLTSLCAIVGGVFTVAGMIDSTAHRTSEFLKKKD